jgi:NADH:ubiquinone oxidoreductase subunit 6 (subunit J)
MVGGFRALDRVLRGEATRLPALRAGTIDIPAGLLIGVLILLGMIAGACTGAYAVITRHQQDPQNALWGWEQLLATTAKVPLLFCLTLVVTFPSLYVFNALVGSRLSMAGMLRLLVAALCVMMAVLASLGPILAFFAVSTTSYPFMKLLNAIAYAIGGSLGLSFLLQTLHRLTVAQGEGADANDTTPEPPLPAGGDEAAGPPPYSEATPAYPSPGALERMRELAPDPRVRTIFRIWVVVFGLVGAQMSWVLRPFIGDPAAPFTLFRPRESNFFQSVMDAIRRLMGW